MHVKELLHNQLKRSCPQIHKVRLNRIFLASSSLLNNGKLSCASIGRHMAGNAFVKHKIKACDRLLGNKKLYSEREQFYSALSKFSIGTKKTIDVIVDWSPCGNREQQLLRASLYTKECCVVLYEEVHYEKSPKGRKYVHEKFLERLSEILPKDLEVTIITDAGFKADWFKMVAQHGWHFEGRVRTNIQYFDGVEWKKCVSLYKKASVTPKYIGNIQLTKEHELECNMYLYKEKLKKNKSKMPMLSSRNSKSLHKGETNTQRRKAQDPWLIVSSKKHSSSRSKKAIESYKKRMKIEHNFRNLKNIQWGVGLDLGRSHDTKRLEILLLIAAIAMYVLWVIGMIAEQNKLHYRYQANTIHTHRVLSILNLAMQVLRCEEKLLKNLNINVNIEEIYCKNQENKVVGIT